MSSTNNKSKLKVYLCDLTYDTIILVSDTMPINIGFIGSYMKSQFGENVEISLFKYPNEAIEAIKTTPPDMIALSNYSWNSNLSEYVASIAKKNNINAITVQGGTNFPHQSNLQLDFLLMRPSTDVYTVLEAEKSCSAIVKRILESNKDRNKIFDKAIDGCVFVHPDTKKSNKKNLVQGKLFERIKDLDDIPSPYLNGMLDKFFDGKLTPFIETNRGCPFTCSFCHTGSNFYHKLNKFSEDRVRNEIEYIGKRAQKLGITNLHIADVNFGMYPQDRKTCEMLVRSREKYNWPLQAMATTGKNSKERVMEITSILGDMFEVNMSMQSMDAQVLKNISRENIKLDHMLAINDKLLAEGRSTKGELILPLPGETKESFIKGLNNLLNNNTSRVTIYTLMLLYGTEFKNPEYRKQFGYKGKYRIVPLDFGEYDGERIFDYEEVGVATKDMSYEDYLFLRVLALFVETLHNGRPFNEFFKYAKQFGIEPAILLKRLYDNRSSASKEIQQLINDFIKETKGELWDSEKDLINHYKKDENYKKLKNGEVGGNLIYKYKSLSLVNLASNWIDYFKKQVLEAIKENKIGIKSLNFVNSELSEIAKFCKLKLDGFLNDKAITKPVDGEFNYDILNWLDQKGQEEKFSDFKSNSKKILSFHFTQDQITMRQDVFRRYGKDINALSKIVTRISNIESQFRKVKKFEDKFVRDIYKKRGEDFVKYALSN